MKLYFQQFFKKRPLWSTTLLLSVMIGSAVAQETTSNHVPNFSYRGTDGMQLQSLEGNTDGTVNGEVPTLWRNFALNGADTTTELVPLAANALFPGSPAMNAIRYTVTAFSGSGTEAFDNFSSLFSLTPGRTYTGSIYLRSDNADNSNQSVAVGLPLFDEAGVFLGIAPGSFGADSVKANWTKFTSPQFTALGKRTTHMSFRLNDDGGDNSVLIAMPELIDTPLENRVPNPGFEGTGGLAAGDVTGPLPDGWRGFGVSGGSITTAIIPLAANTLYPGSPATNALQLTVDTFSGSFGEGIDQTPNFFSLEPAARRVWSEVWIRSANADNSDQSVLIQLPIYDGKGTFTGDTGNFYTIESTVDWNYFGGSSYLTEADTQADLSFRLVDDGGDNSILIALPKLNAIQNDMFDDGYESP